ncbi:Phosphoribosylaminoimidazole carboxylase [Multifurca ochricompacta]|uniref:Phosphoribosylaminoimidazole carboxylase n=1 Tax=Multifurca ochricompacta TaxID=376703 RepID=A0AAD4QMT9_9AGAM|nr:Phosphoribosylaminoimidazole carboxylase [Multifurca ochricompacta]
MLAASASLLNISVVILDVGAQAPAKQVLAPTAPHRTHVDGSFSNPEKIKELAAKVDVLTVEIEHVNVDVLEEVQSTHNVEVHPAPSTIRIIQDKFHQKEHLQSHALPVAPFLPVEPTIQGITDAATILGLPLMLKSKTLAYDGRGNFVLRDLSNLQNALDVLSNRPLYAEKLVPFVKEIAVMVVRTTSGHTYSYPVVETVHKDNICHLVFAPFRSRDAELSQRAHKIAEAAVKSLSGAGIFGVEMFLLGDGQILVNEIAPRPHNSGHYTIEACETSQYENHLRAILSFPIGSTALKVPSAAMLNLLGASNDLSELIDFAKYALSVPGASVHLYGKAECRKGRKMGHITVTADSDAEISARLRPLLQRLPGTSTAADIDLHAPATPEPGLGHSHKKPLVGVIMGSDSDLPVMLPAARILDRFSVPYELTIVSAHRTPNRLVEYARSAASRGLRVIIAGAGGAAHLPGMVAAMTALPVIGVPVKGSSLDGVDSLHSIVQMPVTRDSSGDRGYNNGTNAGLLAVRILAASNPNLVRSMEEYLKDLEKEVLGKVDKLEEIGWEKYEVKRS